MPRGRTIIGQAWLCPQEHFKILNPKPWSFLSFGVNWGLEARVSLTLSHYLASSPAVLV